MKPTLYLRGLGVQAWYNFTELLTTAVLHRKTPENIEYHHGVRYSQGRRQKLNTWCRKDLRERKKPIFIYVHGGGWNSGMTDLRNEYVSHWAELGFFCVSLGYDYAPQTIYPEQIYEVFQGIDYVLDHAAEWNADPDSIVMAGDSAGGYFVSFAGAAAADHALCERLGIPFRHAKTFSLRAVVTISGCFNCASMADPEKPQHKFQDMGIILSLFFGLSLKEVREFLKTSQGKVASPHVSDGYPPAFVIWSSRDWLRYESFDYMEALEKHNIPYAEHECTGILGSHAFGIATIVEPGRRALFDTWNFVLPYLPGFFENAGGEWHFL